jgi:hypothetical protein
MACIYAGYGYSEGSVICLNGGRYICRDNEWRNDGSCFAGVSEGMEEPLNTISSVDGVRLVSSGARRVQLINENDYLSAKIVTLKVSGNSVRRGRFYVAAHRSSRYDIWYLAEKEEGLVQIEKVENAPFEGEQTALQYLEITKVGRPSIRNMSAHHIFVSLDYAMEEGGREVEYPTGFVRLVLSPNIVIPLSAVSSEKHVEKIKFIKWGTVKIQETYLF